MTKSLLLVELDPVTLAAARRAAEVQGLEVEALAAMILRDLFTKLDPAVLPSPPPPPAVPVGPPPPLHIERQALQRKAQQNARFAAPHPTGTPSHVAPPGARAVREAGGDPSGRKSLTTELGPRVSLPSINTETHACRWRDKQLPANQDPRSCAGTCIRRTRQAGTPVPCTLSSDHASSCSDFELAGPHVAPGTWNPQSVPSHIAPQTPRR